MKNTSKPTDKDVYMATPMRVRNCDRCALCPSRMYAKEKDRVVYGAGNPYADTFCLLPCYDYRNGAMVEDIGKIYNEITGKSFLEECYVTRSVKCYYKSDYPIIMPSFNYCLSHLTSELVANGKSYKKVIVFDRNADCYVEGLCRTVGAKFARCISPIVMYFDNEAMVGMLKEDLKLALS